VNIGDLVRVSWIDIRLREEFPNLVGIIVNIYSVTNNIKYDIYMNGRVRPFPYSSDNLEVLSENR